jgi:hypothetical protein
LLLAVAAALAVQLLAGVAVAAALAGIGQERQP